MKILIFVSLCISFMCVNAARHKTAPKQRARATDELQPFTLDEFFTYAFADKKWSGTWVDVDTFMYSSGDEYSLFNATTKTAKPFFPASFLKNYTNPQLKVMKYADDYYLLIKHNITPVYRHSTLALYNLWKVDANDPVQVDENKLQFCHFHPTKPYLIAVQGNNIYMYKDFTNLKLKTEITRTGSKNNYNGVPDWVYEEEVFSRDYAYWMNPYADNFIYAVFDDSKVKDFTFYKYGTPSVFTDQYPTAVSFKYPKVDQNNPTFNLRFSQFDIGSAVDINLGLVTGDSSDYVLYDVAWYDENTIFVVYTNRVQNIMEKKKCDVNTKQCALVDIVKEAQGWLDINVPYTITAGKQSYIEILRSGDFDGLLYASPKDGEEPVTIGSQMTISKLHGASGDAIYFEASKAEAHSQQHVYKVDMKTHNVECMTCDVNTSPNITCKHASAVFSLDKSYMTRICSGPEPARVEIINLETGNTHTWETNSNLYQALEKKTLPIIKDMMITIGEDKIAVRLLLPPSFSEDKKYPLLVDVYAGPNSNQIRDAYGIGWEHYLVTSKNYIYAYIDGRGSGKRGRTLMHKVYKRLGQFEIADQIAATEYLRDNFNYIDEEKIGIWGWSYGGFATAHVLASDVNNTFACGISVAPVTNFMYYDTIYTERYMIQRSKNEENYNKTDLCDKADAFRNKTFLLIHGSADDNVHYQQSMMLARALELADVPFEQISYPDENHSLQHVQKHLYHSMDAFWSKCFSDADRTPDTPPPAPNRVEHNVASLVIICLAVVAMFLN